MIFVGKGSVGRIVLLASLNENTKRDVFLIIEFSETDSEGYSDEGEESWRNAEGERLRDFGVDEEAGIAKKI
jgi:hypothetical protein